MYLGTISRTSATIFYEGVVVKYLNAFEIKKNKISHKLAVIIVRTNISSTLFYKNRVRVDCWCSNNIVKVSGTN